MLKEERLHDLFSSARWQDHFTTLSEVLGFTLSIFSESGTALFTVPGGYPVCRKLLSSPEFRSRCETSCSATLLEALKKGKPLLSKCYARIMSFALPIEYLGEKAVIVGQGSFSSYQDFREYLDLLSSSQPAPVPLSAPLAFTSVQDAQKASLLVSSSVNQLLQNRQEAVTLRRNVESLKQVVGGWGIAAHADRSAVYDNLTASLLALLDVHHLTIFSHDRQMGIYAPLYSRSKNGAEVESFSISEDDPIVRELLAGKPFVLSAEPIHDTRADFLNDTGAFYFFPLRVGEKLASILGIADRVLSESDTRLVTAFCRQAALSLENHLLRHDLYEKFDRFTAIAELTQAISPVQSFEALLQSILEKSAELLKADQGSLMLLDRETDVLLLEVKKGLADGITEKLRIQKGEGIAGRVAQEGEPFLVENVEQDPRTRQKNRLRYKTPSFISVPLKIGDRIIGVLNLADKTTGEVFDREDLRLIQSFATHAAVVLDRTVLEQQTVQLRKLSITDPLTGLLNRRYLYERLEEEVSRSRRHKRQVGVLMLDIDGFKRYNDTFGHLAGDKALALVAEVVLKSVRTMDVVSRYGGDEFVVVLPETDTALAVHIAERIRADVTNTDFRPHPGPIDAGPALTVSIGIVCYPEHGESIETLLDHADKALYRAKRTGRNRIEVFA